MTVESKRLLRYHVATSIDGFIAGPNGEYDWIASDESFDWPAYLAQFDTLLMGRKTYELAASQPGMLKSMGMAVVVLQHARSGAASRCDNHLGRHGRRGSRN